MATIHALELFVSVYRNGSISQTAAAFTCSQPSVSRTVSDLEKEFDTTLFERFHHKLIPTDAGTKLYEHANRVLEDYRAMNMAMHDEKQILRIGSTVTIANTVLMDFLHAFSNAYPHVHVQVTVNNGSCLQSALQKSDLDLALIEDSIHCDDLVSFPFACDSLSLLVPAGHPLCRKNNISLKDLNGLPFLHRDEGSAVREYLNHLFEDHDINVSTVWQSTSTQAIIRAVAEGFGISILPEKMCTMAGYSDRIRILHLSDEDMSRHYYAVHHSQKAVTEAMKAFISILQSTEKTD